MTALTVTFIFLLGAIVFLFANIANRPWAPPWSWGLCVLVIELLRLIPVK